MPNDGITLDVHNEGDITLPGDIANSKLTLAQIGAIVCFAALTSGEVEVSPERISSPEMKAATDELRKLGVIDVQVSGGGVKVVIDLEKAAT
jgi:hypothetical protein